MQYFSLGKGVAQHDAVDGLQIKTGNPQFVGGTAPHPGRQRMQHVGNSTGDQPIAAIRRTVKQAGDRFRRAGNADEIIPRLFRRKKEARILLDVGVVDELEFRPALVQNRERAVEACPGPRRIDVENQCLTRVRVETKDVVIVDVNHAVDHCRQRHALRVLQIVVGLRIDDAGQRSNLEHTDVRAAGCPQPEIVQADGNLRPDRDVGLDEKEVGRDHFRLDVRSGEGDFARSLKVPAQELDVDSLALASAQRRHADHEGAHLGEIRVTPSGWNKQKESTDGETGSFHESKLPRRRKRTCRMSVLILLVK